MTKNKTYYTLLIKGNGKWAIHFGDYDREVVEDEVQDLKESYGAACVTKIIRTGDSQAAIDAKVNELNSK